MNPLLWLELERNHQILVVALIGLAVLVAARPLLRWVRSRQRVRALARWARQQQGSFRIRGDAPLIARLSALDPLGESVLSPNIRHVLDLSAPQGRILIFDHELWVEGFPAPLPHTAVLVEDPDLCLPRFEMHPFYPGGGVELADAPLVARYRTRSHPDERRAAHAVFDQVLGSFADHTGWSVAAGGSHVLCYQAGHQARPEQLSALVEKACAIHALVRRAGLGAADLSAAERSP